MALTATSGGVGRVAAMDEALGAGSELAREEECVACLALRVIRPGSVWEAARPGKVTAMRMDGETAARFCRIWYVDMPSSRTCGRSF